MYSTSSTKKLTNIELMYIYDEYLSKIGMPDVI